MRTLLVGLIALFGFAVPGSSLAETRNIPASLRADVRGCWLWGKELLRITQHGKRLRASVRWSKGGRPKKKLNRPVYLDKKGDAVYFRLPARHHGPIYIAIGRFDTTTRLTVYTRRKGKYGARRTTTLSPCPKRGALATDHWRNDSATAAASRKRSENRPLHDLAPRSDR